jgi:membrane protein DedA with SNARE-associated domain
MVHASLMSWVYDLVNTYGLWALFIGIMLQGIGIPMPGETMLLLAALYAGSTHRLTIGSILLVAATATTVGGMIGYAIGRWIGFGLLVRYGKYVGLDESRLKVGQYLFLRHGGKIVFFGRFVDLLRILAAVLAGANRMSWPYFLFMNALGGICWVLLLGGGAYWFGEQMKRVAGPIEFLLLIVAIGLAVGGIIFFRYHEKELVQRAESAIPGPLLVAPADASGVADALIALAPAQSPLFIESDRECARPPHAAQGRSPWWRRRKSRSQAEA